MTARKPASLAVLQTLFWLCAKSGRQFGGIRPHRIIHWLASRAYGDHAPTAAEFELHTDVWGSRLLLHPHFFLDYQIIAFGAYDAELHRYIQRHVEPGMVCLDVGANIGSVSMHFGQRVAPHGLVHCFEPVPHLIQRFNDNLAENDCNPSVRLHTVALCDRDGECTMGIADEATVNQGMGSLRNIDNSCVKQTISVNTQTLDTFAQHHRLERLDVAKIDIQGCELEFIRGGRRTLERFKPDLLMEVSPSDLAAAGTTSRELLQALGQIGYEIFELRKSGQAGLQVYPDQVDNSFSASNVIACHKSKAGFAQRQHKAVA